MNLRITVLPGDGIGPEVIAQAIRILQVVGRMYGRSFEFHAHPIGGAAIRATGSPLPDETVANCLASDAVFLGAVGGPEFDHLPSGKKPESGLLALRRALGGFANLRPAVCHPSLASCSPLRAELVARADIMIVRELLGGAYFGEPRRIGSNEAFNTMRYSVAEIERVARVGFELARSRRKKLTSVDKANVLEVSQLWRKVVTSLSAQYPDVKLEHIYVDACAMKLVTNPASFDVIVTENLFGDILSDEAAVLTGSLGMLASATIGGQVDLYEPVHGSAPDIAGRGIANPLGAIASAAMLLRYSAKLEQEAQAIERAIEDALSAGHRTADIAGSTPPVSTARMGDLIEEALLSNAPLLANATFEAQR